MNSERRGANKYIILMQAETRRVMKRSRDNVPRPVRWCAQSATVNVLARYAHATLLEAFYASRIANDEKADARFASEDKWVLARLADESFARGLDVVGMSNPHAAGPHAQVELVGLKDRFH